MKIFATVTGDLPVDISTLCNIHYVMQSGTWQNATGEWHRLSPVGDQTGRVMAERLKKARVRYRQTRAIIPPDTCHENQAIRLP